MEKEKRKEMDRWSPTFAGRGDGAVIPFQVGGGERVQRQAVRAWETLLKVQKVLRLVVLRHVGGHVQVGDILTPRKQNNGGLRVLLILHYTCLFFD